jgi:hypothetical protein
MNATRSVVSEGKFNELSAMIADYHNMSISDVKFYGMYNMTRQEVARKYAQYLDEGVAEELNEFAPGDGGDDDGDYDLEFQVYQCNPDNEFEFISGPLQQFNDLGRAHDFAYKLHMKNPDKAFMIWQPSVEHSRGGYGIASDDEQDLAEEKLDEFAPGNGDDREPNEEEILRQLAAQWWNGTEQQMAKAQQTLEAMGWEIGPDESGDDDAGVYVYRIGDDDGRDTIAFGHSELSLDEAESKVIARTSKDLMNPPKIMQHRAKRDQEREVQYRDAQRKVDEGKIIFTNSNAKVNVYFVNPALAHKGLRSNIASGIPYKTVNYFIDFLITRKNPDLNKPKSEYTPEELAKYNRLHSYFEIADAEANTVGESIEENNDYLEEK